MAFGEETWCLPLLIGETVTYSSAFYASSIEANKASMQVYTEENQIKSIAI